MLMPSAFSGIENSSSTFFQSEEPVANGPVAAMTVFSGPAVTFSRGGPPLLRLSVRQHERQTIFLSGLHGHELD